MPKEQIASPGGMNKLQNDIVAVNSKFISHEVTIGSSINVGYTYAYPTGLDASNSVIIGYTVQATNNHWYTNHPGVAVSGNTRDGIAVQTTDSDFVNQKLKILFAKL